MHAIRRNNKLSVRAGAMQYGIPENTVRDRLQGRTKAATKTGPKRILFDEEEDKLARYAR